MFRGIIEDLNVATTIRFRVGKIAEEDVVDRHLDGRLRRFPHIQLRQQVLHCRFQVILANLHSFKYEFATIRDAIMIRQQQSLSFTRFKVVRIRTVGAVKHWNSWSRNMSSNTCKLLRNADLFDVLSDELGGFNVRKWIGKDTNGFM